jgi:pimeloyl-ACP methyl ester carboxylesterase
MRWIAEVDEQVSAAAEADMDTVAETLFRAVAGAAAWEGLPETVKEELTDNSPAILADERNGYLDISAEQLGTILQPTLLVAAEDSPPELAEVTNLMAQALPSARVEWVEGGHLINPAHPAVLSFVDEVLTRR